MGEGESRRKKLDDHLQHQLLYISPTNPNGFGGCEAICGHLEDDERKCNIEGKCPFHYVELTPDNKRIKMIYNTFQLFGWDAMVAAHSIKSEEIPSLMWKFRLFKNFEHQLGEKLRK